MERGKELFDYRSDDWVRLQFNHRQRHRDTLFPAFYFSLSNIFGLTPPTVLQFENSAAPLHMERGKELFDYRSDDGVRLQFNRRKRHRDTL